MVLSTFDLFHALIMLMRTHNQNENNRIILINKILFIFHTDMQHSFIHSFTIDTCEFF